MQELPVETIAADPWPDIVPGLLGLVRAHWSSGEFNQLALSRLPTTGEADPERWREACGSFFRRKVMYEDGDFSVLLPEADFLRPVLDAVERHSGLRACRPRLMQLAPKTCLSYHKDLAPYRYHVPVVTNSSAFFVVEGLTYQMAHPGHLYRLRTNLHHTAVNAHFDQPRLHLVISTA